MFGLGVTCRRAPSAMKAEAGAAALSSKDPKDLFLPMKHGGAGSYSSCLTCEGLELLP